MNDLLVLKFGGAAVATPDSFHSVARLIEERRRSVSHTVVVVSAMGGATDDLIRLARAVSPNPPQREYDMLVSVGERVSMSLLAMALYERGIAAVSLTGSQAGIITCSRHSEARIRDVRPKRVQAVCDAGQVAIVAGFQGVSQNGEITTLGRGGTDTTAVSLAAALHGQVEFFKDVDGVYDFDPKKKSDAMLLKNLSYEEALDIVNQGARVLHARCIELARKNGIPLYVRSFNRPLDDKEGTTISGTGSRRQVPEYEDA